jgi:hypothetical protein
VTRASLIALVAAAGLAAPTLAIAECHEPGADAAAGSSTEATTPAGDGATSDREIADEEVALDDEELDAPEDSAILPSAEGHLESEAPTMEIDCQENPELCAGDPIETASEGPALSVGDDPDDPTGENEAGEVVVAEPDC